MENKLTSKPKKMSTSTPVESGLLTASTEKSNKIFDYDDDEDDRGNEITEEVPLVTTSTIRLPTPTPAKGLSLPGHNLKTIISSPCIR
jgi:hypothetical protein